MNGYLSFRPIRKSKASLRDRQCLPNSNSNLNRKEPSGLIEYVPPVTTPTQEDGEVKPTLTPTLVPDGEPGKLCLRKSNLHQPNDDLRSDWKAKCPSQPEIRDIGKPFVNAFGRGVKPALTA